MVVKPKRLARPQEWTLALPVAGTTGPRHGPRPSVADGKWGRKVLVSRVQIFWTPQLATTKPGKGAYHVVVLTGSS